MLESVSLDSAEKFGSQQEVAEASRMDADVAALGCRLCAGFALLLLAVCASGSAIGASGDSIGRLDLLVGVVDEVFFGGHGGECGLYGD